MNEQRCKMTIRMHFFVVFDVVEGAISHNKFDVESYCLYVCASVAIQFVISPFIILHFGTFYQT